MENTNLFTPRVKCIGYGSSHYPDSCFLPGDILLEYDKPCFGKYYQVEGPYDPSRSVFHTIVERNPHLFTPIKWYEDRSLEDMPPFVMISLLGGDTIEKTETLLKLVKSYGSWADLFAHYPTRDIVPATKEEYDEFIKAK